MTTEEKLINLELTLKEFANQVKRMREVQCDFFKSGSRESLRLSKHLERQVDSTVKRLVTSNDPYSQQELFKE